MKRKREVVMTAVSYRRLDEAERGRVVFEVVGFANDEDYPFPGDLRRS